MCSSDLHLYRETGYPYRMCYRSRPWQGRALPTTPLSHKRVMGIEPTYPAWKAGVLPLNYTRTTNCLCLSHQRRLVSMMKLHLSTLFLNFFYFFNNTHNFIINKQFLIPAMASLKHCPLPAQNDEYLSIIFATQYSLSSFS